MLKESSSLEQQLEELKVLSGIYKPEKSKYQKKNNIEPGTKEWFKLWFARPKLTGENPYGDK